MACQWKKARTGRFKVSGHGIHMSFMCLRLVKILVLTSNEHMPICYPTALPHEEILVRYGPWYGIASPIPGALIGNKGGSSQDSKHQTNEWIQPTCGTIPGLVIYVLWKSRSRKDM